MKNIILIAPPAAGKGTLADRLKKEFDYDYISMGDILREEAKTNEVIKEKMERGILIDDSEVLLSIKNKLAKVEKSYILDGFPRTINQAKAYDEYLLKNNKSLGVVIYLDVPKEELVKRITSRLICQKCKKTYSSIKKELLPKKEGVCDVCGSKLITRKDDTVEVFDQRYEEYQDKTKPLIDYYQEKDKLVTIKTLTPEETYLEAIKIIK